MFKNLINSQIEFAFPPQDSLLTTKIEVPCKYIHVKLPPPLPFWIAQRTTWRPKSQHRVQSLTFRNSLCTAPITLRRAAPGHPPPFIISFFLKDFSLLRSLAALFPRGLLLDWLGFNCSALPDSGWNFTFASPPPLPSGAATALSDFWGTAISKSLSLSLYCLHVDMHDVGQLICIYSHHPLDAFKELSSWDLYYFQIFLYFKRSIVLLWLFSSHLSSSSLINGHALCKHLSSCW